MKFERAFKFMQAGEKIKLPSWGGYWYWDDEKKTVIMHTKDGKEMDIRETERVIYTLSNIFDDGWVLADEENCPELGGVATFGFDEAVKSLKRGFKVKRKSWKHFLCLGDSYFSSVFIFQNEEVCLFPM